MKCPFVIKICTKCKRILVANKFNFNICKSNKDGFQSYCRECKDLWYKEKKRQKTENNPFNNIDVNKVWNHCPFCIKVCCKCKKILVANENNFDKSKTCKWGLSSKCKECVSKYGKNYRKDNKEDIKEKRSRWYIENKEKRQEYHKQYYEKNREREIERSQLWYEENKENRKEYHKQWYKDNKEREKERGRKWYKEHKEEAKEKNKEYHKNNPHIRFNNASKRRQLEESQGNGFTKEQWFEMMEFFDFKCAYSGEYIGGDSKHRTIDHIVPLNKGGEHEVWNLVPMYDSYNYSKFIADMEDWYVQQDFFDIDRLLKIYEWIEYAYKKWR